MNNIHDAIEFLKSDGFIGHLSKSTSKELKETLESAERQYNEEQERRRKAAPLTSEFWMQKTEAYNIVASNERFIKSLDKETAETLRRLLERSVTEVALLPFEQYPQYQDKE